MFLQKHPFLNKYKYMYWNKNFSKPERQKKQIDTMACTNFAHNNATEAVCNLMKKNAEWHPLNLNFFEREAYISKYGNFDFSDRELAKRSGTTEDGNIQKKVNKTAEQGLVPETMWPFTEDMTWEEYYKTIPPHVHQQRKEFAERVDISHEWITKDQFNKRIKESPIIAFVWAWAKDGKGFYYRPEGEGFNHASVIQGKAKKKKGHLVYPFRDTYEPFNKWVYDDNVSNAGYLVHITDIYNMDVKKFVKKHDQKLIRNKKTGEYGAIYRGVLRTASEERSGLFMIDREARGVIGNKGKVDVQDSTWQKLPKKPF